MPINTGIGIDLEFVATASIALLAIGYGGVAWWVGNRHEWLLSTPATYARRPLPGTPDRMGGRRRAMNGRREVGTVKGAVWLHARMGDSLGVA